MSAPTCSLDAAELEAQLERYRELARYAAGIEHGASGVVVSFEEHPPVSLLQHTLEVERACCPFLRIAYDSERRRLAISIENEEHREALGALERALALETAVPAAVEPVSCCTATTLSSCCAPDAKAECCGEMKAGPPARCGCGT